jgi:Fic family protein
MPPTAVAFDPERPYDDLPRLPPAADVETRAILKACIDARAAVAELKQAGHLLPNQAILINTLPILEARASSEIENIVTTTDRLFQYAQDETQPTDAATKEALRYRTALRRGFESLASRPLTTATAVEVCRTLRGSRIANVVEAGLAKRQTASEYLKQLRDVGVLTEIKVGREKLFIHPKLMTLLKSDEHVVHPYE